MGFLSGARKGRSTKKPKGEEGDKHGFAKHVWPEKIINKERRKGKDRSTRVSLECDCPWREAVLKRCSESWHPSSSLIVGAGRAWVSAPPAS